MEKSIRRLETFNARGSDGKVYAVHGYEYLARLDPRMAAQDHWESTGQGEYKLADGRHVEVERDGAMRVGDSDLVLERIG
jgi:hypothetical protein